MADHFTSLCETVLATSKNTTKSSVVPVELEEKIRTDTNAITEMCTRTVGAYMFAQILLLDIINGEEFRPNLHHRRHLIQSSKTSRNGFPKI